MKRLFALILILYSFSISGYAGASDLINAAARGDVDVVKALLEKGGDVNEGDYYGTAYYGTALKSAAEKGHTQIVKLLLDKCVTVIGSDSTTGQMIAAEKNARPAFLIAAENGHTEIVKLLLNAVSMCKPYSNAVDEEGRTAMMIAAKNGHTEIVKLMLDKDANVNEKDNDGQTALMRAADNGHTEVARLLIEKGADVNKKDNHGQTALTRAAWNGQTAIAKLLIEKGADVNVEIGVGWTALINAAFNKHTETAKFLIEKGADVNAEMKDGVTPLMVAAENGIAEVVKLMLRNGANMDYAIVRLESSQDVRKKAGVLMIKRLYEEQKIAAAMTQKKEAERPVIKTDIDKPSLSEAERIMTDNDLAVIIGIEGYQGIPKSDYSYDDAKLVKEYIKALGFKERNIELITDEKATLSSITKTLEAWLKNKAKADSKVFVYYSGHGAPDPATGEAYLVPYDGDPNYLNVTGYPLRRLYDNLGKLQVAEVTVVLDACFSGAGGRSVLANGARPLVMMADVSVLSSNMAVLSATQGTQISTSSPEKGHGIFTYYFLKALKDGKKNIAEIYSYIKPLVEDDAKQLNVQQSPSISPDVEKLKGRFGLRK